MTGRERLLRALNAHPDRVAFDVDGTQLTWAELDARSAAYAGELRQRGVRRGDRVAVFAGSSLGMLVAFVGNVRGGFTHLPINTRYGAAEARHLLDDGAAAALVHDTSEHVLHALTELGDALPAVRVAVADADLAYAGETPPSADDDEAPLLLIYTSGTTGRSKGVEHGADGIVDSIGALTDLWRFDASDRLVLALPLFHVHGLCIGVIGTLLHGLTALVQPRFDPALVVGAFAERGATVFMGVPTMYARLLEHLDAHPGDAAPLRDARLFTSGSAALPASHFARFEAHTGHRILERYGMSETMLTLSNPYEGERRAGTVGFAVPGFDVRVVADDGAEAGTGEPGEVQVRGAGVMCGYRNQPEATEAAFTADGWFRTGDLARVDADGYHHLLGRASADMIKTGGWRLSSREIEEALLLVPGVREAAVVGIADPVWGQRVAAAIVLEASADAGAEDAGAAWLDRIAEHTAEKLADFKRPREVRVVTELPRNALGKLQKHRIRAMIDATRGVVRTADVEEIITLRARVLRPGLATDVARFAEDRDEGTIHLGLFEGERALSCLTLLESTYEGERAWRLRGMATDDGMRGAGLGARLLAWVAEHMQRADTPDVVWCDARLVAVPFYARAGWAIVSDEYDVPNIGPHHKMVLRRDG